MVQEEGLDYLCWLSEFMKTAYRHGADTDEPEGARTIQISDRLALLIAARLDDIVEKALAHG